MDIMSTIFDKSNIHATKLQIGGFHGLWDIAKNKMIAIPLYLIYEKQAKDKELKKKLHSRAYSIIPKQIEAVRKFLKDNGYEVPEGPDLQNKLNDESAFVLSSAILKDEEIAIGLRERLRALLSLETEALRNATDPEVRELIYEFFKEDNKEFGALLKLQKEKKWIDFPPVLLQ